jgi:Family of unknown function (DUF6169)
MSILQPYSVTYRADKYYFETVNSVAYSVEFTEGIHYFLYLPPHIPVFEFNVRVLSAVDVIGQPYDERVEVTIVEILSTFFENNKNSLIYVCDNLDKRQRGRRRKFDGWFKKSRKTLIEKYDVDFINKDMEIFASLLVHVQNPDKDLVVRLFYETYS